MRKKEHTRIVRMGQVEKFDGDLGRIFANVIDPFLILFSGLAEQNETEERRIMQEASSVVVSLPFKRSVAEMAMFAKLPVIERYSELIEILGSRDEESSDEAFGHDLLKKFGELLLAMRENQLGGSGCEGLTADHMIKIFIRDW